MPTEPPYTLTFQDYEKMPSRVYPYDPGICEYCRLEIGEEPDDYCFTPGGQDCLERCRIRADYAESRQGHGDRSSTATPDSG